MKLVQLINIFVILAFLARANETDFDYEPDLMPSPDCFKVVFEESYVTEYQDSEFKIQPKIEDSCGLCFF